MVLVAVRSIQELLVAHVAFAAAEEDVGTLLPLHALVTAEDNVILTFFMLQVCLAHTFFHVPHLKDPSFWIKML